MESDPPEEPTEPGTDAAPADTNGDHTSTTGHAGAPESTDPHDTGVAGEDSTTETTAPPLWRTRRGWLLGGAAALALVVAASLIAIFTEKGPEGVVRDFLDATRQGDVDAALEAAGVTDPPTEEKATFLDPDALSDEWDIASLEGRMADEEEAEASVDVSLEGPDDATTEATLTLTRENDTWRIDEPFVPLPTAVTPMWYYDVNGKRLPFTEDTLRQEYLLLPGFYRFYEDTPDEVEMESINALLLPSEDTDLQGTMAELQSSISGLAAMTSGVELASDDGTPTLTDEGEEAAQQAVNDHVDECAARTSFPLDGCPFNTEYSVSVPDQDAHVDVTDPRWEVVEYPVVTAPSVDGQFHVTDRKRGVIELNATGEDEEIEDEIDLQITCEIITVKLSVGFDAEGEMQLLSEGDRPFDDQEYPETPHDTCS